MFNVHTSRYYPFHVLFLLLRLRNDRCHFGEPTFAFFFFFFLCSSKISAYFIRHYLENTCIVIRLFQTRRKKEESEDRVGPPTTIALSQPSKSPVDDLTLPVRHCEEAKGWNFRSDTDLFIRSDFSIKKKTIKIELNNRILRSYHSHRFNLNRLTAADSKVHRDRRGLL
jgi:hypothetical protein